MGETWSCVLPSYCGSLKERADRMNVYMKRRLIVNLRECNEGFVRGWEGENGRGK